MVVVVVAVGRVGGAQRGGVSTSATIASADRRRIYVNGCVFVYTHTHDSNNNCNCSAAADTKECTTTFADGGVQTKTIAVGVWVCVCAAAFVDDGAATDGCTLTMMMMMGMC